jgi:drug/metabolite transporter (DMT)-like permease
MIAIQPWATLALISSAAYGLSSTVIYYVSDKGPSVNMTAFLFAVYVITSFIIGGLYVYGGLNKSGSIFEFREDLKRGFRNPELLMIGIASGVFTTMANVILYNAYRRAPNPGLCDAVSSLDAFVSLAIGAFFLGTKPQARNIVGMVLMSAAGYLILR